MKSEKKTYLSICSNFTEFPDDIMYEGLITVNLSDNLITQIPIEFCRGSAALNSLAIRTNQLRTIPMQIICMRSLKTLDLDANQIKCIPNELYYLPVLEHLSLSQNKIKYISPKIANLSKSLKRLFLSNNKISELPDEISTLTLLSSLYLHGNPLSTIPCGIAKYNLLNELSIEWLKYSSPPLPRILKGSGGDYLIKCIKDTCNMLLKNGMNRCSFRTLISKFCPLFNSKLEGSSQRKILQTAASDGDLEILDYAIQQKVDINEIDEDGCTPLFYACKNNNCNIIKMLIAHQADPTIGQSPILITIEKGNYEAFKLLCDFGVSVNVIDYLGNGPFHILFSSYGKDPIYHAMIGEMLLTKSIDPNLLNKDLIAPIHVAVRKGVENIVNWIVQINKRNASEKAKQFNIKLESGKDRNTPLHIACKNGSINSIKLLAKNSDLFAKNNEDKTPAQELKSIFAVSKVLSKLRKKQVSTECRTIQLDYSSISKEEYMQSESTKGYIPFSNSVRKAQIPLQVVPNTKIIQKQLPTVKQKEAFDQIWNKENPPYIRYHYMNCLLKESKGISKAIPLFDTSFPTFFVDDMGYKINTNNDLVLNRTALFDDSEIIETARYDEVRRRPRSQNPQYHRAPTTSINSIFTTQNKKSPSVYFNDALRKENQMYMVSNSLKYK